MKEIRKVFKVGSLFAGIGGICSGFQQANLNNEVGYELVWANEIDEYACETYRRNFPHHNLIEGDINKVLNPECISDDQDKEYYKQKKREILENKIDILTGGFPCQAFSVAGDRKGFEDERGNLFWSIINLVNQLDEEHGKPKVLFLENVKNLMGHDNGRTYSVIKNEIRKLGYTVKERVLNTMDFSNLPQNRERIYIVCFLDEAEAAKFTMFDEDKDYLNKFKLIQGPNDRERSIKMIINYSAQVNEKYYYTKEKYPRYFITKDEYESLPENERNSFRVNLDEQVNEMYQFYQVRRGMYVRKNKSNVCPTLTANMGTGGHNVPLIKDHNGVRKLTPEETFKLQGFPIGDKYNLPTEYKNKPYPDSRLYKQAGNAVSVPVVKLIAEELLKILD